jgi:hypothetical protein
MKHHKHHGHHDGHHAHHEMHGVHHEHHRKHRKTGGRNVIEKGDIANDETPKEVYAGAGSDVVKEAAKKKRGGAMKHKAAHLKHLHAHGHHAKHRLDRPARKHGGKVDGMKSPFSAAHDVKTPAGRDVDSGES